MEVDPQVDERRFRLNSLFPQLSTKGERFREGGIF